MRENSPPCAEADGKERGMKEAKKTDKKCAAGEQIRSKCQVTTNLQQTQTTACFINMKVRERHRWAVGSPSVRYQVMTCEAVRGQHSFSGYGL